MSDDLENDSQYAKRYLNSLVELLPQLDTDRIAEVIDIFRLARDRRRTIFVCGNGGSGCIASEMVAEVIKQISYKQKKRFRMIGLNDNMAAVTAYANDVGYDDVFVEQLKNFAEPEDVVIGISGSGNSENVLRAIQYGKRRGCTTIGLTTGLSGQLKDLVHVPMLVPESHMGRLEDCFFILTHIVCYAFYDER